MTRLQQATECTFPVDPDWVDHTGYVFRDGDIQVVIGPFSPVATARARIEHALERFRVSVPGYELVERETLDRPTPGAQLVSHRLGGHMSYFELSLFWALGETTWVFRARGPMATEERCRRAFTSFVETYEPAEPIDE